MTQDEHKAALGLVRYQGNWVSVDAAERLKRIDQELSMAQMKRAADEERVRERLALERDKIAQQQRILDMLRSGELPRDVMSAFGYPWAMRYWGPAAPVTPQPNAD
jgi:hypothetical protein